MVNDEITDPSVDLLNEFGDTTEVAYREALAVPTVSAMTTNDSTPVIEGTHTSEAELTVVVDSTTYTEDNSAVLLDNGDDTWTLSIPSALDDIHV